MENNQKLMEVKREAVKSLLRYYLSEIEEPIENVLTPLGIERFKTLENFEESVAEEEYDIEGGELDDLINYEYLIRVYIEEYDSDREGIEGEIQFWQNYISGYQGALIDNNLLNK